MALTDERTGVNEPPRDEELGKMTLGEHLGELRRRLIISIVGRRSSP